MPGTTLTFTGQKVVVIGGTSGMGLAVARRVLEGGGPGPGTPWVWPPTCSTAPPWTVCAAR
jgi:hypothetical protein